MSLLLNGNVAGKSSEVAVAKNRGGIFVADDLGAQPLEIDMQEQGGNDDRVIDAVEINHVVCVSTNCTYAYEEQKQPNE